MSVSPHLYEVTIDVPASLLEAYLGWLKPHAEEMKSHLYGIQSTDIIVKEEELPTPTDGVLKEEFKGKPYRRLIARYIVESKEQIDDYIANRSAPMRSAAISAFGQEVFSCFKFSRRVVPVSEM
jgi:hypothetical protein